jgi:hypothetical protein
MTTPTAEELFATHFLPLYPEDAKADLARARTADANPAGNPSVLAHLDEAARIFAARGPELFGGGVDLDFTDASVHRLSRELTPARRDAWRKDETLFHVVVHGAAYVGACIVKNHGGAWGARRPLWESVVRLASRAGEADLAVFHWWLKSLAEGASLTLADRYRIHVEIPCTRAEELPVVFPEGRKLPRIAKDVRYDVLHKYVKAHLPELADLGEDFPSPERFAAYAFKALDFAVLGGGRMLLVHGQNADGAHLFWLGAGGFEKAAFVACDAFPEHRVKIEGDKLVVIASVEGKMVVREMLWWGP